MRNRIFQIAAVLLTAIYAVDGIVVHWAHNHCGPTGCVIHQSDRHDHAQDHHGHDHDHHHHGGASEQSSAPAHLPHAPCDEDCAACRYLALTWLPVALEVTPAPAELISLLPSEELATPESAARMRPRCRAPPKEMV